MLAPLERLKNFPIRALTVSCLAFGALAALTSSLLHAQDDAEERLKQFLEETNLRCVGCSPSPQGTWPWQVFLVSGWKQPDGQYLANTCGGSIIWPGYVLTAAHCVVNDKGAVADAAYILAGNVDRTKADRIDVQRIVPHERFDYRVQLNDIAVLRLATDYGGDRWIPLADEEADQKLASPGQPVAIAGWGMTWDYKLVDKEDFLREAQGPVFNPAILRDAEIRVVGRARCQARYGNITDKHICAGEPGKGPCYGDSGGPLMAKAPVRSGYVQIGVTSAVRICGDPFYPGVFTRVSSYRDWVARKIAGK